MGETYPDPRGEPTYPPPQPAGVAPYGQPPPWYGAYAYPQPLRTRPGQLLASSVLAYVLAGVLILTGIVLLFGASAIHTIGNALDGDTSSVTAELAFDGFADLVAAGLLIGGGVTMAGRNRRGRTLLVVGSAMTLAECVYWIFRTSADGGAILFIVIYGALAVLATVFALSGPMTNWFNAAPAAAPGPYSGDYPG